MKARVRGRSRLVNVENPPVNVTHCRPWGSIISIISVYKLLRFTGNVCSRTTQQSGVIFAQSMIVAKTIALFQSSALWRPAGVVYPKLPAKNKDLAGFTFVELCVAITVTALFGAAVFATNSRLMIALKTQKENTAATMVIQQRMESLRACSFTEVATKDYLESNIFNAPTGSEGPLGNLNEQVAVGVYGNTAVAPIMLLRNAQHSTTPQELSTNDTLTNYNLLQVDLLLQWTGANGRTRTRQLSAIFGKGNIGP